MSDDKKQEGGSVTFLNRGQRSFDLGNGRRHAPGATMAYTLDEAKRMEPYAKELVDITKLPGQVDSAKLKADNAGLLSENAALKAQLEALKPSDEGQKPEAPEPRKRK